MSTEPVTPTPVAKVATPASVAPTLEQEARTWLQKHERIVIVAIITLALYFGYGKYVDSTAKLSDLKAAAAEQALVLQKAIVAQDQAQAAQVIAQYQSQLQADHALVASLANAAAARQATVVTQQKTDATLPLTDLAIRLKTLGKTPDGTVVVLGDKVELTQPGAVAVTQELETIPALQADLADQKTEVNSCQAVVSKANDTIASDAKTIVDMKTADVTADNACKAQIKQVKDDARKSKWHWFKTGFFTGNATGFIIGLKAGKLLGL